MTLERVWKGLLVLAVVAAAGIVLVQAGLVSVPWGPDEGEVRILDDGSDDDPSADADPESGNGTAADGEETNGSDGSTNDSDGDADREPKAVVDVEVADDSNERYTGLSDHESLEPGNGMLFIHNQEQELTYVMREMDFDIDIIFINADREITTIHHARAPGPDEDGNDLEYSGRGKWVLEVPRGYANETGIEVGDEVEIDLESNQTTITSAGSGSLERVAATVDREPTMPTAVDAHRISARR
ncbi:hypothetical protein CP556_04705 [Natrinema sp. CBA1119]|uniref:DUF192 domain-containing protein n=1 Tax=Natrinema sp. CBA1119 TaxID=1608465 RepID=UPI000BF40441|nr:DUF192 domain-containing protein [Natrinema sp. CBA1119]PGF15496.1 hypothetical protein CP556_04705 [Natrinema sp. CBA1119]